MLKSSIATLQVKNNFMPNQIMEIFGPTIPSTKVMIKDVYE